jgi:hypothetical protein
MPKLPPKMREKADMVYTRTCMASGSKPERTGLVKKGITP